jgi:hypothetical protein
VNAYKPGGSVHFTATATQLGVLADPPTLVLTVHSPDGSSATPAITRDNVGSYHADFALTLVAAPGVWVARWQAVGSSPNQNALLERRFRVDALDF